MTDFQWISGFFDKLCELHNFTDPALAAPHTLDINEYILLSTCVTGTLHGKYLQQNMFQVIYVKDTEMKTFQIYINETCCRKFLIKVLNYCIHLLSL